MNSSYSLTEQKSPLFESGGKLSLTVYRDAQRWMEALQKYEYDFHHLYEYAALCAEHEGSDPLALELTFQDGSLFQPLLIRGIPRSLNYDGQDASTPYGYSGPLVYSRNSKAKIIVIQQGLELFPSVFASLDIISGFIRCHPIFTSLPSSLPPDVERFDLGKVVIMNLERSVDEQWKIFRRNHRQNIKKLINEGFKAQFDDSTSAIKEFQALYSETMDRLKADPYYRYGAEYFESLLSMKHAKAFFCFVRRNGKTVCGGLFVSCGNMVTAHLSATDSEYLRYAPTKMMFWHVFQSFSLKGAMYLNLGGGVGSHSDNLFNFKAGFSNDHLLFSCLGIIGDAATYHDLTNKRQNPIDTFKNEIEKRVYFPKYRASIPICGL